MPAKTKIAEDDSKYYAKTPQEMSRFEIAELEQMLKEIDEPDEFVPDEEIYGSPEFKELKEQMKLMQPIRHGIIRRYLEKYKWQKKKREDILRSVEATEESPKEILGEDYIHFLDAMPDIKQFLAELEEKDRLNAMNKKPEELEGEVEEVKEVKDKKLKKKEKKEQQKKEVTKKKSKKTDADEDEDETLVDATEQEEKDKKVRKAQ